VQEDVEADAFDYLHSQSSASFLRTSRGKVVLQVVALTLPPLPTPRNASTGDYFEELTRGTNARRYVAMISDC
jgi:hypothetical protein